MFELIRANRRRSMVLVFVMLAILLVLGFAIGSALVPSIGATKFQGDSIRPGFVFYPTAGFIGMAVAFVLWSVQTLVAFVSGDRILLAASRARPIEKQDAPQLYNVVEEMSIAARLPKMPKVYLIDDMSMNAFATGRKPENAAVAVTAGLLGRMNRDELQGVVAHEIGHIVNRDVQFMTMVGIMVGSIVMLSDMFLWTMWFGSAGSSRRYRSSRSSRGGGGQAIVMVIAIVLAILAPLLAQLIYFACSRRREYLADASAAVFTRYPEGLASALEAISSDTQPMQHVNRATAPMYINAPVQSEERKAFDLGSTHPPIKERIRILRGIAGGVSYQHYQNAWAKVGGKTAAAMPASAMAGGVMAMRKAHPDARRQGKKRKSAAQQMRDAGDLLRKVNNFIFLPCVCGMKIKLPPEFKHDHVKCPRCKRVLEVPIAQIAAIAAVGEQLTQQAAPAAVPASHGPEPPLEVTRRGQGWMSFKCSCGAMKNLAPSFTLPNTTCSNCGREIHIKYE